MKIRFGEIVENVLDLFAAAGWFTSGRNGLHSLVNSVRGFFGGRRSDSGNDPSSEWRSERFTGFSKDARSQWGLITGLLAADSGSVTRFVAELSSRDAADDGERVEEFQLYVLNMPNLYKRETKSATSKPQQPGKQGKQDQDDQAKTGSETTVKVTDNRFTESDSRVVYLRSLSNRIRTEAIKALADEFELSGVIMDGKKRQKDLERREARVDAMFDTALKFRLGEEAFDEAARRNPGASPEQLRDIRLWVLKEREKAVSESLGAHGRERMTNRSWFVLAVLGIATIICLAWIHVWHI